MSTTMRAVSGRCVASAIDRGPKSTLLNESRIVIECPLAVYIKSPGGARADFSVPFIQ